MTRGVLSVCASQYVMFCVALVKDDSVGSRGGRMRLRVNARETILSVGGLVVADFSQRGSDCTPTEDGSDSRVV